MEILTVSEKYVAIFDHIARYETENGNWSVRKTYSDAVQLDIDVRQALEREVGGRLRPTSWAILSAPYGALFLAQMGYTKAKLMARLASVGHSGILLPCVQLQEGPLTIVIRNDVETHITPMAIAPLRTEIDT